MTKKMIAQLNNELSMSVKKKKNAKNANLQLADTFSQCVLERSDPLNDIIASFTWLNHLDMKLRMKALHSWLEGRTVSQMDLLEHQILSYIHYKKIR